MVTIVGSIYSFCARSRSTATNNRHLLRKNRAGTRRCNLDFSSHFLIFSQRNSSFKSQLKSLLNRKKVKRSKSVDNISLPGTKYTTQQSNRDSGTMLYDEEFNGTFVKKSGKIKKKKL